MFSRRLLSTLALIVMCSIYIGQLMWGKAAPPVSAHAQVKKGGAPVK